MAQYHLSLSRNFLLIGLILVLILATALGVRSCRRSSSIPFQQLTIGSSHNESDTLIYIAQEQGFFTNNGLKAIIKDYSSGAAAFNGMLKGEAEIATAKPFTRT